MKKIILSMVLAIPLYMLSMVISNTASAKYKNGYSKLTGTCLISDRFGLRAIKLTYSSNCTSKYRLYQGLKWMCSRKARGPFNNPDSYHSARAEKYSNPCRYW